MDTGREAAHAVSGEDRHLPARLQTTTEALAERLGVPHIALVAVVACVLGLPIIPYAFPDREAALFTSVFLPHLGQLRDLTDVLYQGMVVAMLVFSPLATSFMLDRVWRMPSAAPWLSDAITAEVEATADAGRRFAPPFALGTVTMLPMLAQYLTWGHVQGRSDAIVAMLEVAIVGSRFCVLFMFVWCYVRSLVGLARMSRGRLDLLPSHLDPWLGTRPLGSFALALAFVYSVGLALALSIVASGPAGTLMVPVVIGLSLLGLVLFFLPLRSVHRQMTQEKAHEQEWLRDRLASTVAVSRRQPMPAPQDPAVALRDALAVQIAEHHVAAIRTWPIDTSIAFRLASSVALPLVLTLVGRQVVLSVLGV